jgi:hypothetical protein
MPALRGILMALANLPGIRADGPPTTDPRQAAERFQPSILCQLILGVLLLRHLAGHAPKSFREARPLDTGLAGGLIAQQLEGFSLIGDITSGVVLASMLLNAGPLLFSRAFETAYTELVDFCRTTGVSLFSTERERFGISSSRLLSWWLVQQGIDLPAVRLLAWQGQSLPPTELPESLRLAWQRMELIAFLAKTATSYWEAFDDLQIASLGLSRPAQLPPLRGILNSARQSVLHWKWFEDPAAMTVPSTRPSGTKGQLAYVPTTGPAVELVALLLESLGWEVVICKPDEALSRQRAVTYIPEDAAATQPALALYAGKFVAWTTGRARTLQLPSTVARLESLLGAHPSQHQAGRDSGSVETRYDQAMVELSQSAQSIAAPAQ